MPRVGGSFPIPRRAVTAASKRWKYSMVSAMISHFHFAEHPFVCSSIHTLINPSLFLVSLTCAWCACLSLRWAQSHGSREQISDTHRRSDTHTRPVSIPNPTFCTAVVFGPQRQSKHVALVRCLVQTPQTQKRTSPCLTLRPLRTCTHRFHRVLLVRICVLLLRIRGS